MASWPEKPWYWVGKQAKLLGRGGFGRVYLVTDRDGKQWVLKQYNRLDSGIRKDIETLRALQQQGITRRCGVPDIQSVAMIPAWNQRAKLVPSVEQEYVRGQNLLDVMRRRSLEPMEALAIAEDLLETLSCLHGAGLAHRDVKLENVIWDDRHARLIDYDFTCQDESALLGGVPRCDQASAAGTISYASPELYQQLSGEDGEVERNDQAGDIWALGIMLWELISNKTIEAPESLEQVESIPDQVAEAPSDERLIQSAPLFSLIRSMLQIDPAQRPSAAQLLDRLR